MHRRDVTLLVLAASPSGPYTPVQIQKALFLLSREAPELFDMHSKFSFQPYDYGPFDKDVYTEIGNLSVGGLAEIAIQPGRGMKTYLATAKGREIAAAKRNELPEDQMDFVGEVAAFVRSLSFSDLVSAIYKAYPEMREKSIFVGQ